MCTAFLPASHSGMHDYAPHVRSSWLKRSGSGNTLDAVGPRKAGGDAVGSIVGGVLGSLLAAALLAAAGAGACYGLV